MVEHLLFVGLLLLLDAMPMVGGVGGDEYAGKDRASDRFTIVVVVVLSIGRYASKLHQMMV